MLFERLNSKRKILQDKLSIKALNENEKIEKTKGIKLYFDGVPDNRDVYNISAPFHYHGQQYLLGRIESRNAQDSISGFFRRTRPGHYNFCPEFPFFKLEDPFYSWMGDDFIFGGVQIEHKDDKIEYKTVFHRGTGPHDLNDLPFAEGPLGMKDIRLTLLPDGHIIVFTRPQGDRGGRGKIGVTLIDSLEELTPKLIDNAPLLHTGFNDENWGGVNEVHVIDSSWVGLLSHKAEYVNLAEKSDPDVKYRRYIATTFKYNWRTGEVTPMKEVAEREHFPSGPSKRPDLENVIFAGGLVRRDDGNAELYCGLSDTEAGYIVIPDPFGVD